MFKVLPVLLGVDRTGDSTGVVHVGSRSVYRPRGGGGTEGFTNNLLVYLGGEEVKRNVESPSGRT